MSVRNRAARVFAAVVMALTLSSAAFAQKIEYQVLSTSRTSTMEKDMQAAAAAGFRFAGVMGGNTAIGGAEVVVIMTKDVERLAYEYRLLAANKTSTMQKELQAAGNAGFAFMGQTVFKSGFGGQEVVVILERQKNAKELVQFEYLLLATNKTSTMQKELTQAGEQGFEFVGVTVGKTAMGGDEVVSILRRKAR